jgi:hypothetical protein
VKRPTSGWSPSWRQYGIRFQARNAAYTFSFSAEELAKIEAATRGMGLMRAVKDAIGNLFPK